MEIPSQIFGNEKPVEKIPKNYLSLIFKEVMTEEGFNIDNTNKEIVNTLFLYFSGDENFNKFRTVENKPSLNKGILIYGNAGVGKSFLFYCIKQIGKRIYKERGIKKMLFGHISCGSFVNIYMMASRKDNPMDMDITKYYKSKYFIDDLGIEPLAFNSYELMEQVLFERHRTHSMTFCTTNLTPEGIGSKYGFRIGDRITEMFNIIKWSGESKRD
jgi:DNA replication protein DnaC